MVSMDRKGKKITFSLLQNVQVMATGQRSIDDPKSGERRQYSTVTLNTTPAQAQNIIVARDVGKVTALLRNPQDKQISNNNSTDVANLLGVKTDGKTMTLEGEKQVPVLYGGRGSKLPPEGLKMGQTTAPSSNITNDSMSESNAIPVMNGTRAAPHSNSISN
jgi:pilus assembly protein CpaB